MEKLGKVKDLYDTAERLAIAFFFTKDVGWAGKSMSANLAARRFASWPDAYNRVFFSEASQPLRLAPGELTNDLLKATNMPEKGSQTPSHSPLTTTCRQASPPTQITRSGTAQGSTAPPLHELQNERWLLVRLDPDPRDGQFRVHIILLRRRCWGFHNQGEAVPGQLTWQCPGSS